MPDTDPRTEKELQRLRRLPENRVCPNCLKEDRIGFKGVCMVYKTFVCSECKSAHQSFSHRTKAVDMSIWTMDEVKTLDERNGGGNKVARATWLAKVRDSDRPTKESTLDIYKKFIERAYIEKIWYQEASGEQVELSSPGDSGKPLRPPPDARTAGDGYSLQQLEAISEHRERRHRHKGHHRHEEGESGERRSKSESRKHRRHKHRDQEGALSGNPSSREDSWPNGISCPSSPGDSQWWPASSPEVQPAASMAGMAGMAPGFPYPAAAVATALATGSSEHSSGFVPGAQAHGAVSWAPQPHYQPRHQASPQTSPLPWATPQSVAPTSFYSPVPSDATPGRGPSSTSLEWEPTNPWMPPIDATNPWADALAAKFSLKAGHSQVASGWSGVCAAAQAVAAHA